MDSLWESLESLFAITMWRPEGVPLINTVLSGNRIQTESSLPTRKIRNYVADSAGNRRDWRTTKIGNETHNESACGEDGVLEFAINQNLVATGVEYILDGETTKPETESTYEIENPDSNWRVGFIELEFDLDGRRFRATSLPNVVPGNEWPVSDCTTPAECYG